MDQPPPDERMLAAFHKALGAAKPRAKAARERERLRRLEMTPDGTEAERDRGRERRLEMTPDDMEAERDRGRVRRLDMTPEEMEEERERARGRRLSQTPGDVEVERNRARMRRLAMTPDDMEEERGRGRVRRAAANSDAIAAERARSQRRRQEMRANRRGAPWRAQSDEWQWDELPARGYGRISGMNKVCPHCSARLFKDEPKGICCLNGAIRLEPVGFPPEPLATYLRERSPLASHFREGIRLYNTAFAMASPEGGLFLSTSF
jgi:hypothetical protein